MRFFLCFILLNFLTIYVFATNITTNSVTNITGNITEEKRIPNIYLRDRTTNEIYLLTPGRRYDAVYFIAVPITYYMTYNLIQQKNWYLRKNYNLDAADEVFLYFNTFFLPLLVAYYDYTFVEKSKKIYNLESNVFFEKHKLIFYLEFLKLDF